MKTNAVRLYGKQDLRLEEFDLPEVTDDGVLIKIISDSVCMSTYKETLQGSDHIRVPNNINEEPIIIGHELTGIVLKAGKNMEKEYPIGAQVACYPPGKQMTDDVGYAFTTFGGDATYGVLNDPEQIRQHLIVDKYPSFYEVSGVEPLFCVIGGFNAMVHQVDGTHDINVGVVPGGNLIILGGCGPMGITAIDYALEKDNGPKHVVVTDIDDVKMDRVKKMITVEYAASKGIRLDYVNTKDLEDAKQYLLDLTDGKGYDDVLVFVPAAPVAELGNQIMARNGCMNLFAGPVDHNFSAMINLYDCHYRNTKIVGSSGGTLSDYMEALNMVKDEKINLAHMITHIGGLNAAIETTLNVPKIPGGKKLIYSHIDLPLTCIDDFGKLGERNPLFKKLDEICQRYNGLWNKEAEKALLEHFEVTLEA